MNVGGACAAVGMHGGVSEGCGLNLIMATTIKPIPSSSEAVGPSLEEILSRHELKEEDLDRECPRDIRNDISVEFGADWEMIGLYLEFSLDELGDIRQQHSSQEICRVALLDIWGKRKGEGATFLKLARAFHRRKRRDLVDLLCTKLKSALTALVPLPGNVTSLEIPPATYQGDQNVSGMAQCSYDIYLTFLLCIIKQVSKAAYDRQRRFDSFSYRLYSGKCHQSLDTL